MNCKFLVQVVTKRLNEGAECSKGMGLLGARLGGWSMHLSGLFYPRENDKF